MVVLGADELRSKLRQMGLSPEAVRAAWPEWWSDESQGSLSATAELSYTVARRLGLLPSSLLDEEPRYVWHDVARFKNLATDLSSTEAAAITSFGQVVGRAAILATASSPSPLPSALDLRRVILAGDGTVNLGSLVATCWAVGIPVFQLKLFPLPAKRMHAMSVAHGDRYAVLLGHESSFASRVAFTLAHELGHIALSHHASGPAVIDMDEPDSEDGDNEEREANQYALTLLTGGPDFSVEGRPDPSPRSLADESRRVGEELRVDPGSIVSAYAYSSGSWSTAMLALRLLGQGDEPVSTQLNGIAASQLAWEELSADSSVYLQRVLGLEGGNLA